MTRRDAITLGVVAVLLGALQAVRDVEVNRTLRTLATGLVRCAEVRQ